MSDPIRASTTLPKRARFACGPQGDPPTGQVGKVGGGRTPTREPEHRGSPDEHSSQTHPGGGGVEDILHHAGAPTGEDPREEEDAKDGEALLPGGHEPGGIECLQAGDEGCGGIDDGEHARQPGADSYEERPSRPQRVMSPVVDRAFVGEDGGQLGQHERTGDKKERAADHPVGEAGRTARRQGG